MSALACSRQLRKPGRVASEKTTSRYQSKRLQRSPLPNLLHEGLNLDAAARGSPSPVRRAVCGKPNRREVFHGEIETSSRNAEHSLSRSSFASRGDSCTSP